MHGISKLIREKHCTIETGTKQIQIYTPVIKHLLFAHPHQLHKLHSNKASSHVLYLDSGHVLVLVLCVKQTTHIILLIN